MIQIDAITPLRSAIEKLSEIYPGIDSEFYYDKLKLYPENQWFCPRADGYSICNDLAGWNIVESARQPIWINNSFKGYRISFRWREDLKYDALCTV